MEGRRVEPCVDGYPLFPICYTIYASLCLPLRLCLIKNWFPPYLRDLRGWKIITKYSHVDCVGKQLNSLYLRAFDLAYRSHYIVGYLLVARLSGGLTWIVVLGA